MAHTPQITRHDDDRDVPMVLVERTDLAAVLDFVIGWYPGYEDAISWPPRTDGGEYEWMQAARRLRKAVDG